MVHKALKNSKLLFRRGVQKALHIHQYITKKVTLAKTGYPCTINNKTSGKCRLGGQQGGQINSIIKVAAGV